MTGRTLLSILQVARSYRHEVAMDAANGRRTWFKVGALASSILLVGGAIAYSMGAFDSILGQESSSKAPAYIGGSKSIVIKDFVLSPIATQPSAPSEPSK
jgi:hypothetical protein